MARIRQSYGRRSVQRRAFVADRDITRVLEDVHHHAAVLRPAFRGGIARHGLRLAEAAGFQLRGTNPLTDQVAAHRRGTALREPLVLA